MILKYQVLADKVLKVIVNENKIPDNSNLATKAALNAKVTNIEKKPYTSQFINL